VSDHLRAVDAPLERLKALHPLKIDLSLDRMHRILAALGHPERRLPRVIHVAGTNGKGSTAAYLRAIAEAAGIPTHVFTSPHLVRFAERVRLDGTLIEEGYLAEVLERVEQANAGAPITFFEVTTAAAFYAFAETPADLLILEVGLGGVMDATNVIPQTAVSVITPIDYDHKEFLGDTLTAIAGEKAGILKRDAPAVIARQADEAREALERAAARVGARPRWMGQDFDAYLQNGRLAVQLKDRLLDLPAPSLVGAHQADNAGLAVAAALALDDRRIDEAALARGVAGAVWPARMQRLTTGRYGRAAASAGADLWLDGGHNPHGARAVAAAMADLMRDGRPATLIAGLLANKDARAFFDAFAPLKPQVFAIPFEADAAASPDAIAQAAGAAGLQAQVCGSIEAALHLALAREPKPHILICGSLYLAGEGLAADPETWPA
jgi:dihydrofolate synthase / folylpolyglutamate synthase